EVPAPQEPPGPMDLTAPLALRVLPDPPAPLVQQDSPARPEQREPTDPTAPQELPVPQDRLDPPVSQEPPARPELPDLTDPTAPPARRAPPARPEPTEQSAPPVPLVRPDRLARRAQLDRWPQTSSEVTREGKMSWRAASSACSPPNATDKSRMCSCRFP